MVLTQVSALIPVFPVVETPAPEGRNARPICHHVAFEMPVVKELKTADSQYGVTTPYTLAITEAVAERWLTPQD